MSVSASWESKPSQPRPHFRPDIEGLRAIAVVLVVGYHAGIPGLNGGYVGVDIFFVLSGYLITSLLVREIERTGSIDLLAFYARRARRLLPALALVLVVTMLFSAILYAPFEQDVIARTAAYTAAFASNFYFAREATNYLAQSADSNPLLHTWSLGVEEQFYLVWPLFILLASGALLSHTKSVKRGTLLAVMTLVGVSSFALSAYWTAIHEPWAFFLSPPRAWEFALGALAVLTPPLVLSQSLREKLPQSLRHATSAKLTTLLWFALGCLGLIGILLAGTLLDSTTPYPGIAALLPTLSTALLLRVGARRPAIGISSVLALKPLQWIGNISYGWYLWHWPLLALPLVLYPNLRLPARLGLVLVSLGLAIVSYRLVENPIRRGRVLARPPLLTLGIAAVAIIALVVFALSWQTAALRWAALPQQASFTEARNDVPDVYLDNCHADAFATSVTLARCTYANTAGSTTIVLFGDSHAAQWFPALESLAKQRGWRLVSLTKSSCPAVDTTYFNTVVGHLYAECTAWRQSALATIRQLHPDLVVMSSFAKYPIKIKSWANGTASILKSLTNTTKQIILIRDTPYPGFDIPTCLARATWDPLLDPHTPCAFQGSTAKSLEIFAQQKWAANQFKNVSIVDLNAYICPASPCPAQRNGMVIYRDNTHLSKTFVTGQVDLLATHLNAVVSK